MKMLIDSQWVEASGGNWREIRNPGTGEVIDKVPVATLQDAERALQAAQRGKEAMARLPEMVESGDFADVRSLLGL